MNFNYPVLGLHTCIYLRKYDKYFYLSKTISTRKSKTKRKPVIHGPVTDCWSVVLLDSVNPHIDVGQMEGALVMGLGYLLYEKEVYDPQSGRLLTNSMHVRIPIQHTSM